jgi:predicted pyridoxine 5'-phosphate oxidase superfamily flavin-nucleotide-binding protein
MAEPGPPRLTSDVVFSPSIKTVQERRGSRAGFARWEERRGFRSTVTEDLAAFIAERDSFYFATASAAGQPYIQHRGGPKGFLRVLDERTLAFADYTGNRQYITTGNLLENDRAFIFLMDYANRQRIKLWGSARAVEDDAGLFERLGPTGQARREQAIVFTLEAWDINCPQHIPQLFPAEEVAQAIGALRARVEALEAENARLRAVLAKSDTGSGA